MKDLGIIYRTTPNNTLENIMIYLKTPKKSIENIMIYLETPNKSLENIMIYVANHFFARKLLLRSEFLKKVMFILKLI